MDDRATHLFAERKRPTSNAQCSMLNSDDGLSWTLGVRRWALDVCLPLIISSFELIELIDIRGVIVAINGDDHRQTNRGFGSGDRN